MEKNNLANAKGKVVLYALPQALVPMMPLASNFK